jgi:hypothetical protein
VDNTGDGVWSEIVGPAILLVKGVCNLEAEVGAGAFVVLETEEAVGSPGATSGKIPLPRSIYWATTIITTTTTRRGNEDHTHNNRQNNEQVSSKHSQPTFW